MRRPVKPFVTEYKGNARRAAASPGLSLKLEDDAPASQARPSAPRSEHQRFGSAPQAEDTYEAALRAADALFSPAPTRDESASENGVPASRGWDADASEREAVATSEAAAGPTKGRILRVIDEAPAQALIDLEIEHAPKRRGRKPGSKNKPKPAPSFAEGLVAARASFDPASDAAGYAVTRQEPAREAAVRVVATARPARPTMPTPTQAKAPSVPRRPRVDPYAWVRTKLKPGERWKRRLPKVIW